MYGYVDNIIKHLYLDYMTLIINLELMLNF